MFFDDFIEKYQKYKYEKRKLDAKEKIKGAIEEYKELLEENEEKEEGFFSFLKKLFSKSYWVETLKGFSDAILSFFRKFKNKDYSIGTAQDWFETIVFVIVAIIIIRAFIGELRWIPSGSMKPTLIEKDKVFVEKIVSLKRPVHRGDILVFYPPQSEAQKGRGFWAGFARLTGIFCKDIAYIKRVIALPGDKFEIKQNKKGESSVYINDELLYEPYIAESENWPDCEKEKLSCGPLYIPDDMYFMMGDNRGHSRDSRFWGYLPKENIIGRAVMVFRSKPIGGKNDVNYYDSENLDDIDF